MPFYQWWWTPFFDETIQNVLEARFEARQWAFCKTLAHALAWPLVVYEAMTEFANSTRPFKHEDFLQFYALDPEFSSALLLALTLHVKRPREEWSFDRHLIEVDDVTWKPRLRKNVPKLSWKEIVGLLEPNDKSQNRPKAVANRVHKERARRIGILNKWEKHFEAKESLPEKIGIDNYPLDVVPSESFQIAYLPPQRLKKKGR